MYMGDSNDFDTLNVILIRDPMLYIYIVVVPPGAAGENFSYFCNHFIFSRYILIVLVRF